MNSQHTPGPWTVENLTEQAGQSWFNVASDGSAVAEAISDSATARLIAAAPDMLAALQELEEFLDNQADVDDGRANDAMRHLTEVRAAIAKACAK